MYKRPPPGTPGESDWPGGRNRPGGDSRPRTMRDSGPDRERDRQRWFRGDPRITPPPESPGAQALGRNQITDGGISTSRETLARWFARLQLLDLSENRLTRYGIGILDAARGGCDVTLDVSRNVQAAGGGEMPVCVGEFMSGVLSDVTGLAEAAELRRRVRIQRCGPGIARTQRAENFSSCRWAIRSA